jgi:NADPH:quinone reductase
VHAFYGNLMGVPTLQPTDLPASILLTYPQVFDHVPDQDSLRARVGDVFDLVVNGDLTPSIGTPSIGRRYDLADAPQVHRDLASRRTTGKLLPLP